MMPLVGEGVPQDHLLCTQGRSIVPPHGLYRTSTGMSLVLPNERYPTVFGNTTLFAHGRLFWFSLQTHSSYIG